MECNKDEASRAKEIAKKKFEAKDYLGSQKFALKAQSLYPGLDGIQHMLTTLNVYISSENKINGEIDWYKVLEVNPKADEETIKKQYRKLALVLHPDKNKSIGADGAFKIISEAWNLLSDKFQRSVYDQNRNIEKFVKQKVSKMNPKTEAQKGKSAKKKSTTTNGTASDLSNRQNYPITPTFWTVCHRCRLQHEYLRMFLHRNLLCPGCNLPYYAFEYPPPISKTPSQWKSFLKKPTAQTGSFQTGLGPFDQRGSGWDPFSKTGPLADHVATAAQLAFEKSKREREDALNAMKRDREADLERETESMLDSSEAKQRKVDKVTQGAKMSSFEPDKRELALEEIWRVNRYRPVAIKFVCIYQTLFERMSFEETYFVSLLEHLVYEHDLLQNKM